MEKAGYLLENYHYFHLRDSAGQERDFHFHDFDKLVILLSGKVSYLVENEDYFLEPRDILLVRHHCIHKAQIDRSEPYERIIVYLNRSFFERTLPGAGLMDCFDLADRQNRHLFKPQEEQWQSIREVLKNYEKSDSCPPLQDALMLQLLILIGQLSPSDPDSFDPMDPKIRDTLSYIGEHLGDRLSVDLLADRLFLSRYYFMRLFKAHTGQSVHSYVREKRLLYAARLIREGMSASAAAMQSGFTDYSSFHRAFVSSFGCTPGKIKN